MKLIDRLRAIIAQGESVASDEIEATVPAARAFFPKFKSYSLTSKIFAVLIPVAILAGLYAVGINGLQAAAHHVFREGDRPILTQADIKHLQSQVDKLREDVDSKPSKADVYNAVKASSDALSQTFKGSGPTMLEFNQVKDDVRQLQIEAAARDEKAAPVTTGSIKPKKKKAASAKPAPSITDPSSWTTILP